MGLAAGANRAQKTAEQCATDTPGVVISESAAGLADLRQPDTDLVIWRRALPNRLHAWLGRLDLVDGSTIRILVDPQNLRSALLPLLDPMRLPSCDLRELLIADIQALVTNFSDVARTKLVDVRLESISDNACWKFHRDCVEARLLTTYRGPATEWVQPPHAKQALLEQQQYDGPMEQLGNNDVALFKGSCAGPGSGIVHRSPPIMGTGLMRLLLCLNKPLTTGGNPSIEVRS